MHEELLILAGHCMPDHIQLELERRLSGFSNDLCSIVLNDQEVVALVEEHVWNEREIFALARDSDLLVSFVRVNVQAHLVDTLRVLVDPSVEHLSDTFDLQGQAKHDPLLGLPTDKNALVFRHVRWNEL